MMNKTVRLLLIAWLLIAATFTVGAWTLQDDRTIIVVRSNESRTLLWNPETHHEVRNETADGNVILTVQPKERK